MFSTRIDTNFPLNPTTAYFFAKLNHLFDDGQLAKCKLAAQEYVRTPQFKAITPFDEYFEDITTARGCIVLNDELDEVKSPPSMVMARNHMAPYHETQAEKYITPFIYPNLSEKEKDAWRSEINTCINVYLKKREVKYNAFSDDIIKYIKDGSLPRNKQENDLVDTFKNLTSEEKGNLIKKINDTFANELRKSPPKNSTALDK